MAGRLLECLARYRMELGVLSHSNIDRIRYGIGILHYYTEHHTEVKSKSIIQNGRVKKENQ